MNTACTLDVHRKVASLLKLLGRALLVHCEWGRKECFQNGWNELPVEAMNDPAHLALLGTGNLGCRLGDVSGGLITIDIDDDAEVQPFLDINPRLNSTLRTVGARGCQLWFRTSLPCPPTRKISRHGKPWGELRSNGAQSIIDGQHPNGRRYQNNWHRPIDLDVSEIRWPDGILNPLIGNSGSPTHATHATHATQATQVILTDSLSCLSDGLLFPDTLIQQALPSHTGQNHDLLFHLARLVRTMEASQQTAFAPGARHNIFQRWFARAQGFVKPNLTEHDYWDEFEIAYENVRFLLGEQVLQKVWETSAGEVPPALAAYLDKMHIPCPKRRRLANLCRLLQIEWGSCRSFYLACRTVDRLFNVRHDWGNRWLRRLEAAKVIRTTLKGTWNKTTGERIASEFQYMLAPEACGTITGDLLLSERPGMPSGVSPESPGNV